MNKLQSENKRFREREQEELGELVKEVFQSPVFPVCRVLDNVAAVQHVTMPQPSELPTDAFAHAVEAVPVGDWWRS